MMAATHPVGSHCQHGGGCHAAHTCRSSSLAKGRSRSRRMTSCVSRSWMVTIQGDCNSQPRHKERLQEGTKEAKEVP